MRTILMGPPGAGKTVVAEKICREFDMPFVKVGSLLRELPSSHKHYRTIQKAMSEGVLAPNHIVADIVRMEVSKYPRGFIMDGWIRQLSDRDQYDPEPNIVIFMNCSKDNCQKRILNRSSCRVDNTVHSFSDEVCRLCGGILERRIDDNQETFNKRWQVYEDRTIPVLAFYKEQGILKEVDANLDILSVLDQVRIIFRRKQ